MLKRPKGWKLGNKWVGPFRILREVGEFQVVDVTPSQRGIDGFPRARPARLRQRINSPNRYGYD